MAYPTKTDRDSILLAAMRQIEEAGLQTLSIRGVAAALGLAPNALYRYFSDRSALESAITATSARAMHEAMALAAKDRNPVESIRAVSHAYIRFARDRRHVYEMIMRSCSACPEDSAAQVQLWAFFVEQVTQVVGTEKARQASIALWGLLHGMTALDYAPVLGAAGAVDGFEYGLEAWLASATQDNL